MWTVKDPNLTEQENRHPTARPLFNFCAKLNKKTLNIAPLDIAACRPRKDQFNNSLMPSFHSLIVPFLGTDYKTDMVNGCRDRVGFPLGTADARVVPVPAV
jgi:hypothetical protein